jgi:hypothetical protein
MLNYLKKLSHSYMFRHFRVIFRELVINTLPSYASISNAAVGTAVYNQGVSHRFYASSHIIVVEIVPLLVIVQNNKSCTVQSLK